MKRIFFAMLFAALAIASNVSAQEDYNMIIKMPDGTTITLSTSDVEEVTFDNGELVVSGETLKQMLAILSDRIKMHDDNIADLYYYCSRLENMVYSFVSKEDLESWLSKIYNDMSAYVTRDDIQYYNSLFGQVADINSKIVLLHTYIDSQSERIDNLVNDFSLVENLRDNVEALISNVNSQGDAILDLQYRQSNMEAFIQALADEFYNQMMINKVQDQEIFQLKSDLQALKEAVLELQQK